MMLTSSQSHEWFQNETFVTVTIFAKNVKPDQAKVNIGQNPPPIWYIRNCILIVCAEDDWNKAEVRKPTFDGRFTR